MIEKLFAAQLESYKESLPRWEKQKEIEIKRDNGYAMIKIENDIKKLKRDWYLLGDKGAEEVVSLLYGIPTNQLNTIPEMPDLKIIRF